MAIGALVAGGAIRLVRAQDRAAAAVPTVAIGVAPTISALITGTGGEDPVTRGVMVAVRDLNADRLGAGDLRFDVRLPPSGTPTAVGAAAAFRDDPSVVGAVGPTDSQSVLDALPVYGDVEHGGARGLVAISPTASSPVLSGRSRWWFRVCPDDAVASRVAAAFARDSLGAKRAAVIYRNDVYGKGWSRAFVNAFTARGGTVVLRAPDVARLSGWAEPYVAYADRSHADVLVVAGSAPDALQLVRATRAIGREIPMLGGDGLSDIRDPEAHHALGAVRYTALFDARHPATALGRHFVEAYTATYGELPSQQAALAYDAALLLGRAVRSVGTRRVAIRDYLEGVGSTRPAFTGATGAIAFDARHEVVDKPVVLARVERP